MEILLSPPFCVDVFIKTFFVIFNGSSQIEFQMNFGLPNFVPAQPRYILIVLLSGPPFFSKIINPLFSPKLKLQPSVEPGRSSSTPARLWARGDRLLLRH